MSDFVDLYREHGRHLEEAGGNPHTANRPRWDAPAEEIESHLRKLNSHRSDVVDPMDASYVLYWDVASLYSQSST